MVFVALYGAPLSQVRDEVGQVLALLQLLVPSPDIAQRHFKELCHIPWGEACLPALPQAPQPLQFQLILGCSSSWDAYLAVSVLVLVESFAWDEFFLGIAAPWYAPYLRDMLQHVLGSFIDAVLLQSGDVHSKA